MASTTNKSPTPLFRYAQRFCQQHWYLLLFSRLKSSRLKMRSVQHWSLLFLCFTADRFITLFLYERYLRSCTFCSPTTTSLDGFCTVGSLISINIGTGIVDQFCFCKINTRSHKQLLLLLNQIFSKGHCVNVPCLQNNWVKERVSNVVLEYVSWLHLLADNKDFISRTMMVPSVILSGYHDTAPVFTVISVIISSFGFVSRKSRHREADMRAIQPRQALTGGGTPARSRCLSWVLTSPAPAIYFHQVSLMSSR